MALATWLPCWLPGGPRFTHLSQGARVREKAADAYIFGRGDDAVGGNPHRARIHQFQLFEFFLLLNLDKQLYVEQFEATVSQSSVPSPLLTLRRASVYIMYK